MSTDVWLYLINPLLIIAGGVITWLLKSKTEELRATEARLHEERRKLYMELLDPHIRIFAAVKDKNSSQKMTDIIQRMLSYDYKKTELHLKLLGSDAVVRAHNALMQHIFKMESAPDQQATMKETMHLWGRLFLEVRKSLGDKKSRLKELEMFESFLKDVEKLSEPPQR